MRCPLPAAAMTRLFMARPLRTIDVWDSSDRGCRRCRSTSSAGRIRTRAPNMDIAAVKFHFFFFFLDCGGGGEPDHPRPGPSEPRHTDGVVPRLRMDLGISAYIHSYEVQFIRSRGTCCVCGSLRSYCLFWNLLLGCLHGSAVSTASQSNSLGAT